MAHSGCRSLTVRRAPASLNLNRIPLISKHNRLLQPSRKREAMGHAASRVLALTCQQMNIQAGNPHARGGPRPPRAAAPAAAPAQTAAAPPPPAPPGGPPPPTPPPRPPAATARARRATAAAAAAAAPSAPLGDLRAERGRD